MNISYDGRVAVVVGATSGIGRATAQAFAGAGAKVVVAGRRDELGAEVVRGIADSGGEATFVRPDVTDEAQVAALMDSAVERYAGSTAPSTTPAATSTRAWPTRRTRISSSWSTPTRAAPGRASSTRSA
jgi:NAD(P)-dependent dehydrogenase (short-subunit alcohol dehydrogenase family)